jgi:hypothetical protein
MHVASLLTSAMFDVEIDGRPASIAQALPDWSPHDRFGVVIDEALGGTGASHLIQVASVAFYDVKPARRRELPVYPEIYAFHVGRWHGSHSAFDFWPARREVIVEGDHRNLLDAINDRAITRLAIPEREPGEIKHRQKEPEAALDRMVQAFLYDPSGRVAQPDLVIAGNDAKTEYSPGRVLRPLYPDAKTPPTPRPGPKGTIVKERDPAYGEWLEARRHDVTDAQRDAIEQARESRKRNGTTSEAYRRIPVEEAVARLGLGRA